MQGSIGVFWGIVSLRRGPRDLPAAWSLLAVVAALLAAIDFTMTVGWEGPALALARGGVDVLVTALVFVPLLRLRGQGHRLLQTLTALFGAEVLLSLPLLPFVLPAQAGVHPLFGDLLFLGLMAWNLLVNGHIVRLALEVPLLNGLAVAMSFTILSLLIDRAWPAAGAS